MQSCLIQSESINEEILTSHQHSFLKIPLEETVELFHFFLGKRGGKGPCCFSREAWSLLGIGSGGVVRSRSVSRFGSRGLRSGTVRYSVTLFSTVKASSFGDESSPFLWGEFPDGTFSLSFLGWSSVLPFPEVS